MSDIEILNYALTLEHQEATFYRETMRPMNEQIARYVDAIVADEAAHVSAFNAAIRQYGGMSSRRRCKIPADDCMLTEGETKRFGAPACVR